MKIPRFKLRKSTRSTLSGLGIAIASLYALASAYEEARDNLMRFFISSVLLLVLILVIAAGVVAAFYGLRYLGRKLAGRLTKEAEDRRE